LGYAGKSQKKKRLEKDPGQSPGNTGILSEQKSFQKS
jgi:hypothetical protein